MAKGKNSAALFEVINSGKRTGAGLLRTPKWWFKGRPRGASDVAPAIVSREVEAPQIEADQEPQAEVAQTISPRASRANLRVDRMRNEVTMRMRFGTMVVVSFAILVAMGLAYVVGRHVAGGPESANASDASTEQIRQQPPTPNTMDVPHRSTPRQTAPSKGNNSPPAVSSKRGETARGHDTGASGANGNVFNPEVKPQVSGPRAFGKNYAILNSSPPAGTKVLQQACDYLNKAGVPCSVEKAPQGFNPDGTWVAIISRQGFSGASDEDYKAFVRELTAASKGFTKVRFEPALCKWQ